MNIFLSIIKVIILITGLSSILWADSSKVPFPKNYKNEVLYFKNDRGSITEEVFINKKAMKSLQNVEKLPDNTIITLVEYFAKDKKGSDGYALKGDIKRFVVMQKDSNSKYNGWNYQTFKKDGTVIETDEAGCASCHNSASSKDYVFTLNDMKDFRLK